MQNGAQNRSYPYDYTISSADTWEYKTITIPGDTTGTWATDNTKSHQIFWNLGVSSSYTATANAWVGAQRWGSTTGTANTLGTLNATWFITGVQLEVGEKATPFEHRSFGDELARCERYYQKSYEYETVPGALTRKGAIGFICANSGNGEQSTLRFLTRMRASPTFNMYNTVSGAKDSIRNYTDSTNVGVAYNEISQAGFTGGTNAPDTGDLFFYHYVAHAEL